MYTATLMDFPYTCELLIPCNMFVVWVYRVNDPWVLSTSSITLLKDCLWNCSRGITWINNSGYLLVFLIRLNTELLRVLNSCGRYIISIVLFHWLGQVLVLAYILLCVKLCECVNKVLDPLQCRYPYIHTFTFIWPYISVLYDNARVIPKDWGQGLSWSSEWCEMWAFAYLNHSNGLRKVQFFT